MIRVENLTIDGILSDINLTIAPGERLGIIGESGSGKSMTALAIMGLLPAGLRATGTVDVDGVDMVAAPERVRRTVRGTKVGMVFQEPMSALDPLMPVGRQIAEASSPERARSLLGEVGVDRYNAYPHELSGGQRQRVLIAMAIAGDPDLLICDEPTTALDVTVQDTILKLLDSLVQSRGMALMFVSHDLAVVQRMTDRVLIFHQGSIADPESDYAKKLIAAAQPGPPAHAHSVGEPIVTLDNVSLTRGTTLAVDDVSLTIRRGERLGIVGGSGSGKTSLLRLIAGLSTADQGTVEVGGRLQMVFQDPQSSLNPRIKVGKSIRESGVDQARTDEVLDQVGLPGVSSRFPHEFSGGQRQRISIARAAAPRPEILLADEPVSALDVTVRRQVLALLDSLVDEYGLTLVFVSHDLSVVREVCPTIAVIHQGRIVETGPTEEIWANPQHEYTRSLLQAIPGACG
ncbi:ABC transporter ATP-binding protein [Corynebacterium breve]|uniref:ABC transporter ATP-binding protein n=1 Tax=Corynebacterium breve TaxID=3049799 RepID=A0ABY8VBW5_9CORY|nr:ABC transporter ATP-binding protein [Corynebacterium breve]WIM67126.1 ABC transporter ATP-binding protein [Corynebacterium breve]